MVDFWQTQFHHYGGINLFATQCCNTTGNKDIPPIVANKMTQASQ